METKKSKKRINKEDRMKQILEAAMTAFVEKGFNASTTLEIAKAAEI
ncbi:TetR family transcriptional regulator [Clostridium sp.]|nr:TetR family transcriptional regulator [Clostridium sp.]MBK5241482.1 TetR family transcriptional regulator [Clostridium sp.]